MAGGMALGFMMGSMMRPRYGMIGPAYPRYGYGPRYGGGGFGHHGRYP
jgi:hypothetical protein